MLLCDLGVCLSTALPLGGFLPVELLRSELSGEILFY